MKFYQVLHLIKLDKWTRFWFIPESRKETLFTPIKKVAYNSDYDSWCCNVNSDMEVLEISEQDNIWRIIISNADYNNLPF